MEGHLKLLNRWGKKDPSILDESLHASIQELDRMKNLVQELLDLSRAEQIEIKTRDHSTLLIKTLSRIIKNFEVIHENFTFELIEHKLKNSTVQISENHFEQIMIILLDNAVKYSDEIQKVDVSIEEDHDHKMVRITVRDYGLGIPEEDLSKIFHRFYRVDKARSRAKGGNGLGLSIAKQLVESYEGDIRATSELGKGTSITFSLPVNKDAI
jgi:signal transduction histidine kinase